VTVDQNNRSCLLSGLRVADLSMGWSGPLCTRHLADMGAEVIKVEALQYMDWWRGWDLNEEQMAEAMYEQSSSFNLMNRNKLGITLDLTHPRGAELFKKLVSLSDMVVENQAPEVLPKLGLDYPRLKEINPGVIMISLPAFGCTGEWRNYRAYGSTVEQASGLPHLTGQPEWPPTMQHVAYGDAVAGIQATAAVLVAVWHKQHSGEGQHIDLSQVESLFPLEAHGIIEQSMNHSATQRQGNRHRRHAPHGIFPCEGEDQWIAITITGDSEWQALCRVIQRPDLSQDQRFVLEKDRKQNEEVLESTLTTWTRQHSPDEAMGALQQEGVPAARVRPPYGLLEDIHLLERNFFEWKERAFVGDQPNPQPPYRIPRGMRGIETPSPCLGEHNRLVFCGLLGLSDLEYDELEAMQIIGNKPVKR
jgi:crotonobetainyl-CoA:carnitine CoA-transferase CaiB-like acyl-CoA transferase